MNYSDNSDLFWNRDIRIKQGKVYKVNLNTHTIPVAIRKL